MPLKPAVVIALLAILGAAIAVIPALGDDPQAPPPPVELRDDHSDRPEDGSRPSGEGGRRAREDRAAPAPSPISPPPAPAPEPPPPAPPVPAPPPTPPPMDDDDGDDDGTESADD